MTDSDPESHRTASDSTGRLLAAAFEALEFPEHKGLPLANGSDYDFSGFTQWRSQSGVKATAAETIQQYAREQGALSRCALNRLYFAERVITSWLQRLSLDAQLLNMLGQWQCGLIAAIASDAEAVAEQSQHPLRRLLRAIEQHGVGWYGDLGRAGREWLDQLESISATFNGAEVANKDVLWHHFERTQQLIEKENGRVQILEKRLRDAEAGGDRVWYYRELVNHRLNALFRQFSMPAAVGDFLKGPWRDSMQLWLLEEGVQGENWLRYAKLAETLVWAMQDHADAQAKQKLYPIAAHLVDELAKGLVSFKHNPQESESWLSNLQELLMQRVKGLAIQLIPVPPLPQQPGFAVRTDLTTDQGYGLVGNWYLHLETGVRQKCLAYLPYQEAVVWVNYLGRKISAQPWGEVSLELKSQALQPFRAQILLDEMLTSITQRFLGIHALQAKQRESVRQREEARERMEEAARELARQKAEAEAARIQKEQEEAARRYEEERRRAQEAAAKAELEAEAARRLEVRQSAREALDRMTLGGWIELIEGDERKRGKLAVRINATDKLVFVDRLGLRIGDFKRDDLVERIVEGSARIVDEGRDFDQRLARVVGSMRSKGPN